MLYGKYYQPPGNALIDLQLADAPASKPGQSTLSVIIEAYRKLTPRQILDNKLSNLTTPFDHTLAYLHNALYLVLHAFSGSTREVALHGRLEVVWQFYDVGPALGLVGLGLVILVLRGGWDLWRWIGRRRGGAADAERGTAAGSDAAGSGADGPSAAVSRFSWRWPGLVPLCLLSLLITYLFWAMTLLGPRGTIVHQGSYFVELLGMALGLMGWWSVSRRAAAVVVGASAAFTLYVYVRYTPTFQGPGTPFPHGASSSVALLLAFSVLGCTAALWWVGRATPMPPATPAAPPIPTSLASIIPAQGPLEADPDQTATKHGPADVSMLTVTDTSSD
jgi:hypothetical protein